jgi:hypothetical protein
MRNAGLGLSCSGQVGSPRRQPRVTGPFCVQRCGMPATPITPGSTLGFSFLISPVRQTGSQSDRVRC